MLKIYQNVGHIDFRQLMDVYEETNRISGQKFYPKKPENLQLLFAEQDFYQYLELFFEDSAAAYAVWGEDGIYKAALRLERYDNGFLITALEVLPSDRRKGYATKLLDAVIGYATENAAIPLYSHIHKENKPSIATHRRCGFSMLSEDAVFLDGSHRKDYYTFIWNKKGTPR